MISHDDRWQIHGSLSAVYEPDRSTPPSYYKMAPMPFRRTRSVEKGRGVAGASIASSIREKFALDLRWVPFHTRRRTAQRSARKEYEYCLPSISVRNRGICLGNLGFGRPSQFIASMPTSHALLTRRYIIGESHFSPAKWRSQYYWKNASYIPVGDGNLPLFRQLARFTVIIRSFCWRVFSVAHFSEIRMLFNVRILKNDAISGSIDATSTVRDIARLP